MEPVGESDGQGREGAAVKPQDFIALIGPAAQASARQTQIPASFTVAQAALESGWGESGLTQPFKI
jgi:flagellum-specific peptidoglycan hydrolase FlgJ